MLMLYTYWRGSSADRFAWIPSKIMKENKIFLFKLLELVCLLVYIEMNMESFWDFIIQSKQVTT